MNRIQSKDHRIGTSGINKMPLSCFDDKIYFQKIDIMDLLMVIRVNHKENQKTSYLSNYSEKFSLSSY